MIDYALVIDDQVLEFPVSEDHISARFHPLSMYRPCEYPDPPVVDELHYVVAFPETVMTDKVIIGYRVEEYSLENLMLRMCSGEAGPTSETLPYAVTEPFTLAVEDKIITMVQLRTQERLDIFARTREYAGIQSAITYLSSNVAKFRAEAEYCRDMRDETWNTLYALMSDVKLGIKPMPASFEEIAAVLPPLEWPV